jgi:hypothetical protein
MADEQQLRANAAAATAPTDQYVDTRVRPAAAQAIAQGRQRVQAAIADPVNNPGEALRYAAGQTLSDIGKNQQEFYNEKIVQDDPTMAADNKAVNDAKGLLPTMKELATRPRAVISSVAQSAPEMLGAMGLTRAALAVRGLGAAEIQAAATAAGDKAFQETLLKAASNPATRSNAPALASQARAQAVNDFAQGGAERLAGGVGAVSEAAQSGLDARAGVQDFVEQQKDVDLQRNNQRYRELRQTNTEQDAKRILGDELGSQAAGPAALWTVGASKATGAADAWGKTMAGSPTTGRQVLGRTAKEGLEEGAQNPGEDYAGYAAKVQADPTQEFDPGGSVAQGLVVGLAQGGGMHSSGHLLSKISGDEQVQPVLLAGRPVTTYSDQQLQTYAKSGVLTADVKAKVEGEIQRRATAAPEVAAPPADQADALDGALQQYAQNAGIATPAPEPGSAPQAPANPAAPPAATAGAPGDVIPSPVSTQGTLADMERKAADERARAAAELAQRQRPADLPPAQLPLADNPLDNLANADQVQRAAGARIVMPDYGSSASSGVSHLESARSQNDVALAVGRSSLDKLRSQGNTNLPNLAPIQDRGLFRRARAVGEAMHLATGSMPVFFEDTGPHAPDGFELNGVAYVNAANLERSVQFTTFHETYHVAEERARRGDQSAQRFVDMAGSIFDMISPEGKRAYAEQYLFRNQVADGKMTVDEALAHPKLKSEMVADFFGKRGDDPTFLKELARRDPKNFGEFVRRWIDSITNLIDKLRGKMVDYGNKDVDQYIKKLSHAKAVAASALIEWRKTNPRFAENVSKAGATHTPGNARQARLDEFMSPETSSELGAYKASAKAGYEGLTPEQRRTAEDQLMPRLYAAQQAKPAFDRALERAAGRAGGEAVLAPVKLLPRAAQRMMLDHGGDASKAKDLLRGTVVVDTINDIPKAMAAIGQHFEVLDVKDRFTKPTSSGYRDVLINVRAPGGMTAEIQIHTPETHAARDLAHKVYTEQRSLEAAGVTTGPRVEAAKELQRKVYGEAYQASQKQAEPSFSKKKNSEPPKPPAKPEIGAKIASDLGLTKKMLAATSLEFATGFAKQQAFSTPHVGSLAATVNFLEERRLKSGLRVLDLNNEEDRKLTSRLMVAEAMGAINAAGNALEWYDKTIRTMLGRLAVKFPELRTDPEARTAFLLTLAVTSQGQNVETNLGATMDLYTEYRQTGHFPETGRGESASQMAGNFKLLNELVDEFGGINKLAQFLRTEFTVGELTKAGFKIGGELADEGVLGSSVLGPKIGFGFFSNLTGNFEPVTMDMWFMRTIGRLIGKLKSFDAKKFDKQTGDFMAALEQTGTDGLYAADFNPALVAAAKSQIEDEDGNMGANEDAIVELAREVDRKHQRDFANNRAGFDAKTRIKTPLVFAAGNIVKSMDKPKDAPASGGERRLMRAVVKDAVRILQRQLGDRVPAASLQALIWYPEQELYRSLGTRLTVTSQDYAGAALKVLKAEGINEDTILAAGELGSGQARPDDGGHDAAGAQANGQGSGRLDALKGKERDEFLANRYERTQLEKEAVEPKRVRVIFEVAPDPNNAKLTAIWNRLAVDARLAISKRIAKVIVPKVLAGYGTKALSATQIGSYLEFTNPSFALMLEKGGNALEISKELGFVLNQDSMMLLAPNEFKGSDPVGAIRISLGSMSESKVDEIYQQLREIRVNGEQPVGGQSTINGQMTVLNYSDVATDELGRLIDEKLGGAYPVTGHEVHSAFPAKKDYDYGLPSSDPRGNAGLARQRARALRSEASRLLGRELRAAEAASQSAPGESQAAADGDAKEGLTLRSSVKQAVDQIKEYASDFGDGMFRTPKTDAKAMPEIIKALGERYGIKLQAVNNDIDTRADKIYVLNVNGEKAGERYSRDSYISIKNNAVWVNVGSMTPGLAGGAIYQIAGAYARNNGKVFIGDPDGISEAGKRRRLENMISLALKYGNTDFMRPHDDMLHGWNGLMWSNNSDHNLMHLLKTSNRLTYKLVPDLKEISFDPSTGKFSRDGADFGRADFQRLAERSREAAPLTDRAGMPGSGTLRLAVIFQSLAVGSGQAEAAGSGLGVRDRVVGADLLRSNLGESLQGLRYSTKQDNFTSKAIDDAASKPGTTIVEMSPQDFLTLAKPGYDPAKQRGADAQVKKGEPFTEIPVLRVKAGADGAAKVTFHNGRHRSRALIKAGVESMPVAIEGDAPTGVLQAQTSDKTVSVDGLAPSFSSKQGAWYSALERRLSAADMKAAPAQGWKGLVKGLVAKGDVKIDEVEWSGVNEWLALQQGKVTKDQVLQFLAGNGVRIEETKLDSATGAADAVNRDFVGTGYTAESDEIDGQVVFIDPDGDAVDYSDLPAKLQAIVDRHSGTSQGEAKYGQYTLPGGTNYREVLLTLPEKEPDFRVDDFIDEMRDKYGREAIYNIDGVTSTIKREFPNMLSEQDQIRYEEAVASTRKDPKPYQSGHWDQPNVLAHIRLNDRTDADGSKVLFVEEIQSDWAQEGKKKGFATPTDIKPVTSKEMDTFVDTMLDEYVAQSVAAGADRVRAEREGLHMQYSDLAQAVGRADEYERMRAGRTLAARGVDPAVPRAPFVDKTDKWVALAMKRIIKMAVDGGYDKVAFVNGDQSAERYDLSNQVNYIQWNPGFSSDPNVMRALVQLETTDGKTIGFEVDTPAGGKGVIAEGDFEGKSLEDVLGKEIAQKINQDDSGDLRGLDLKVGGEGMKAFYDKIVPAVAKDVLRKLGGGGMTTVRIGVEMNGVTAADNGVVVERNTAGQYVLVTSDGTRANMMTFDSYAAAEAEIESSESDVNVTQQPGFTITPAMREKAADGLPMFSRKQTDNSGAFDPTNPDIRFSHQQQPVPEETRYEASRRVIQDQHIRMRKLREWALENGAVLSVASDVYSAEERMHGRTATRIEDFREKVFKPLIERTQKAGFTMVDVAQVLHAQHAEERNKQVAKINPKMPDGGSGMSTADARQILATASPQLKTIAGQFQAITTRSRDILLRGGIITQEQAAAWDAAYKSYVPLKGGDDADAAKTGIGKGLSVNGGNKRALGHKVRDEHIVENIMRDHERAIMLVEKNRVGQSMMLWLTEMADPRIGTVAQPVKRAMLVNSRQYDVRANNPALSVATFDTKAEAEKFIRQQILIKSPGAHRLVIREMIGDPMVQYRAKPMLEENEAQVYVNGHAVRMQLNDPMLAQSFKRLNADQMGKLVQLSRDVNTFLARAYTGYNPAFIPRNLIRDFGSGVIKITGNFGAGTTAGVLAKYPKALATLLRYNFSGTSTPLIDQYRASGGSTGAAYLGDLERIGTNIQREYESYQGAMALARQGKKLAAARVAAGKMVGLLTGYIENLNAATENAMRLATFEQILKETRSLEQAASAAKNSTLNFNRKGEMGPTLGAAYLFFNPNVQDTASIYDMLTKGAHKKQAIAILAGMQALAYMLAALQFGGSDDDYERWLKISSNVKDRNLIIRTGQDTFITIPVPFGFGIFHSLGNAMFDLQRGSNINELSVSIANSLLSNFSPVGNPLEGAKTWGTADPKGFVEMIPGFAVGELFRDAARIVANRSSFGSPIVPDSKFDVGRPDFLRLNRSTKGTSYDMLTRGISDLTGGTATQGGGIDMSPETLKFWANALTGGTGGFVSDITHLVGLGVRAGMDNPENDNLWPDRNEIPIWRDYSKQERVTDSRRAFWDASNEAKAALQDFRRATKAGDDDGARKVESGRGELLSLGRIADNHAKQIKALRDRVDEINGDKTLSLAYQRGAIKQIEREEAEVYDQFLRSVTQARHTQEEMKTVRNSSR